METVILSNKEFFKIKEFLRIPDSKDSLLRTKLIEFYKNKENLNILLPIILQQTRLSLRSLDWFVTNYCK